MGCEIVFMVNGEKRIVMETDLLSNEVSLDSIALKLINSIKHQDLIDALQIRETIREVSFLDLQGGIVHNCTVEALANKWPSLDWEGLDLSMKLLATAKFEYFGKGLRRCFVENGTDTILVINPNNLLEVLQLHQYLTVKKKLSDITTETLEELDSSLVKEALEIVSKVDLLEEKSVVEAAKELAEKDPNSDKKKRAYAILLARYEIMKRFANPPTNVRDLIIDFMEDSEKYNFLPLMNGRRSVKSTLQNVANILLGKSVREATYKDGFANEMMNRGKYSPKKKVFEITKEDFLHAVEIRKAKMAAEREKLSLEDRQFLDDLSRFTINSMPLTWKRLVDKLIDTTDEDFPYTFYLQDDNNLQFKSQPKTLGLRYVDFDSKKIKSLTPFKNADGSIQTYHGYTIYKEPGAGRYYISRHLLTTESYGKHYNSPKECMDAINNRVKNNPIMDEAFIEFKTISDLLVVYVPLLFRTGLVVKTLFVPSAGDATKSAILNIAEKDFIKEEWDLIHKSGYGANKNTLDRFYLYVDAHFINREDIKKTCDTAEKAACFLYMMNANKSGLNVRSRSDGLMELNALNSLKNARYIYYVVEEVSKGNKPKGGFPLYVVQLYKVENGILVDASQVKTVYATRLIPVAEKGISNNTIEIDSKTSRPMPVITLLNELAELLQNKLGLKVNIMTKSELETAGFKEEAKNEVKGFIKDGLIYINSSVANENTLFHEFTHLMLGVLKVTNLDLYVALVDAVANNLKALNIKHRIRETYPDRTETDINEEVFAEMFADRYLYGRDFDAFLNLKFDNAAKEVNKGYSNVFNTTETINWGTNLTNIFRKFAFDLNAQLNNGLTITDDVKKYRLASNWIEKLIRLNKLDSSKGILEDCL